MGMLVTSCAFRLPFELDLLTQGLLSVSKKLARSQIQIRELEISRMTEPSTRT